MATLSLDRIFSRASDMSKEKAITSNGFRYRVSEFVGNQRQKLNWNSTHNNHWSWFCSERFCAEGAPHVNSNNRMQRDRDIPCTSCTPFIELLTWSFLLVN